MLFSLINGRLFASNQCCVYVYFSIVSAIALLFNAHITATASEQKQFEEAPQTRFDDWSLQCAPISDDTTNPHQNSFKRCEILQRVYVDNVEVLNVTVTKRPSSTPPFKAAKDWQLAVITPLDLYLPAGVRLNSAKHELLQIPFSSCGLSGCWGTSVASSVLIAAFKKNNKASARFLMISGKRVEVVFSLRGFSKALAALQSISATVQQNSAPGHAQTSKTPNKQSKQGAEQ
ncbi:invasion associated locus B family protein [Polycladidibacter hongkongensis]|uniref:invasion associated locus B family protein n=1 Tax=Polycladidibacter hongkongensis TaxID=1647556 RepID=UPI00082C2225|nr:invasion associated locus B family protein [Pseudovibrio hongkongensis]